MGIGNTPELAYAKAQLAAGQKLPLSGTVFVSVKDEDKDAVFDAVSILYKLGFKIIATGGTATFLSEKNIPTDRINKVREGRPHIVDMIKNNEIDLVINTTSDKKAIAESFSIRRSTLMFNIPYTTTMAGARATALAIKAMTEDRLDVKTIQEYNE